MSDNGSDNHTGDDAPDPSAAPREGCLTGETAHPAGRTRAGGAGRQTGAAQMPAAAGGTGGAGLVRLTDYDPRHPGRVLGELRSYWHSLRKGRAIPSRADIEPQGLHGALGYAFILERIAPGAARFRLAGRHLIDLMGMEVRGMPLCSFFNPASRGHLSDVLETVFAGPQIAELTLNSGGSYARPVLPARMLLMPLRSDLGDVTRAIGAVVAEGEIGRPPRRFDLTGEALTAVIDGARTLSPSPTVAGFAEPPSPPWTATDEFARPAARTTTPAATDRADPPSPKPADAVHSVEGRRAMFRVIRGGQDS